MNRISRMRGSTRVNRGWVGGQKAGPEASSMGVEDHREPGTHGPAGTMLSQSGVPCLRSEGRGARGDPQSAGAALPVQAVRADVRRDGGDGAVPAADGAG